MPVWGQDGRPQGYYWIEVNAEDLSSVIASKELSIWENVVSQIAVRTDFADEKTFYVLEGIYSVETGNKVCIQEGLYHLEPSQEYDMHLYHYHPSKGKSKAYIQCATRHPSINFVTSDTMLINSRYDMKHLRFVTTRSMRSVQAVISIYRGKGGGKHKTHTLDFDLRLEIAGVWLSQVLLGGLIGIILATPHIIAALSNDQLSKNVKILIVVVSLIAGIIAGIVASLKLKRDI